MGPTNIWGYPFQTGFALKQWLIRISNHLYEITTASIFDIPIFQFPFTLPLKGREWVI